MGGEFGAIGPGNKRSPFTALSRFDSTMREAGILIVSCARYDTTSAIIFLIIITLLYYLLLKIRLAFLLTTLAEGACFRARSDHPIKSNNYFIVFLLPHKKHLLNRLMN